MEGRERSAWLAISAALFVLHGVVAAEEKSAASAPQERIVLFDGKSLDGFTTWLKDTHHEDPRRVFRITDGLLHVTGDGFGYLATKQSYRDYRLRLEYKWGQKTDGGKFVRNSGVLLHGSGAEGGGGGTWMPSIECQLAQGCAGDLIVIRGKDHEGNVVPVQIAAETALGPDKRPRWSPGGEKKIFTNRQLWWNKHDPDFQELLDTRGKNDVESPRDEWTQVEIVCAGPRISVHINGHHVNDAVDVFPAAGKILLQSEGHEVYFRHVELLPLE
jgi:hypothetical protein